MWHAAAVSQFLALGEVGIPAERTFVDKTSGSTTDRPGLRALLGYARDGDVIVVHTLDRLGRTVRDTLNLIHDLAGRGVWVRNLADPIRIDSSDPDDPMAQLAVVLLALFGQMERTYTLERAAHARPVATAKGRRIGRPSVVEPPAQPLPPPPTPPSRPGHRRRHPTAEAGTRPATTPRQLAWLEDPGPAVDADHASLPEVSHAPGRARY